MRDRGAGRSTAGVEQQDNLWSAAYGRTPENESSTPAAVAGAGWQTRKGVLSSRAAFADALGPLTRILGCFPASPSRRLYLHRGVFDRGRGRGRHGGLLRLHGDPLVLRRGRARRLVGLLLGRDALLRVRVRAARVLALRRGRRARGAFRDERALRGDLELRRGRGALRLRRALLLAGGVFGVGLLRAGVHGGTGASGEEAGRARAVSKTDGCGGRRKRVADHTSFAATAAFSSLCGRRQMGRRVSTLASAGDARLLTSFASASSFCSDEQRATGRRSVSVIHRGSRRRRNAGGTHLLARALLRFLLLLRFALTHGTQTRSACVQADTR